MSRQQAPRNLSLTEELERLEQSITLTLQEIDSNFSKAHRIVTTSILPIVEDYAKHSNDVWEGSKFWKQFFEASANVSLSGYEEPALEDDATHSETTATDFDTTNAHEQYVVDTAADGQTQADDDDDDLSFSVDSPTHATGVQSTPKLPVSPAKFSDGKPNFAKSVAAFRSPSPRKYTGKNPLAAERSLDEPRTPHSPADFRAQSSPFEPESAFQLSSRRPPPNNDPLMHRGVLDKNYRVQATPHTQRRQRHDQGARGTPTATAATITQKLSLFDDSPGSSPALPRPQLRSELFSPAKAGARTPGISVMTPARKTGLAPPTTSIGRELFSSQDKAYAAARDRTAHIFDSDDDSSGPDTTVAPKTLQFYVPQSRLLQTPAREASKRIVEDLLLTAGADVTDDIEGEEGEGGGEWGVTAKLEDEDETSPSVVRRAAYDADDTF